MGKLLPYQSLTTLRRARELEALDEHRNGAIIERRLPLAIAANEERAARLARRELEEAKTHLESSRESYDRLLAAKAAG